MDDWEELMGALSPQETQFAMEAQVQDRLARLVPGVDMKLAQSMLERQKGWSASTTFVGHYCTVPSNIPCEDTRLSGEMNLFTEREKNWSFFCIFDGHAGPRTAHVLTELMPNVIGERLFNSGCMSRPYVPNDNFVTQTIKNAFKYVDEQMLTQAKEHIESSHIDMSFKFMMTAPVLSGSCALVALFDPKNSVLRVANTGDSRAVLGRWDSELGKYVAKPMSIDQTGFNPDEVKRLRDEHPGEDVVDPKTGRVHGIAVSRAFGDARWKWPNDFTQLVHEKLFGPAPRPNGVIKTPPYLTAEPDVMETQVQTGAKPDFLIMASDGLWDNISSENAVLCVQQWLDKYKPADFVGRDAETEAAKLQQKLETPPFNRSGRDAALSYDTPGDDDTYYDENEKCLKWRVTPKHFVVEDDHAGIHLVKNALGGSRRNLFCGLLGVQPPLSRNVRDDITVQVLFFGQDVKQDFRKSMAWFTGETDDPSPAGSPPLIGSK
jgi:pyruvate dehydrogenase phosphatase